MKPVDNSSAIPAARSEARGDRRSEMDGRANRADGAAATTDTARPGETRSSTESVSLTQTAAELLQLEQQLRALPDIDQARVERVRQAIADGTYEVDAEAVVDSLLRSDRELA